MRPPGADDLLHLVTLATRPSHSHMFLQRAPAWALTEGRATTHLRCRASDATDAQE